LCIGIKAMPPELKDGSCLSLRYARILSLFKITSSKTRRGNMPGPPACVIVDWPAAVGVPVANREAMIAKLCLRLVCHQRTTNNRRKENTVENRASHRSQSRTPRRSWRRMMRGTMRGQGSHIGTSERGRFDHLSKRSMARFRRGRNLGISFLLQK
jgi:hypothetical protein